MIKRITYTKENIDKIIDLYKNKKYRIVDIHNETGFSKTSISRILVKYCNIQIRQKNKMTSELEKQICFDYQNGLNPIEISNKYNFHVKTIRNKLTENGFKLKKGPNNLFNEHYFDIIDTEEKAYFLGYLMADGNISTYNNQYYIKCACSRKDEELIYKFKEVLDSKNSITHAKYYNVKSVTEKTSFSISSKHMFMTLQSYGFKTNKSGNEVMSNKIPKKLRNHFIRGLFDGDGITCVKKCKRSGFISSKEMLLSIMNELNLYKTLNHPKTQLKNLYYFLLGKKESKILYNYMYSNATFYLKRKRDRMDIIIKKTPRKSK